MEQIIVGLIIIMIFVGLFGFMALTTLKTYEFYRQEGYKAGLTKAMELTGLRMTIWDKMQTELHQTKYCAGLDIIGLLRAEIEKSK